MSKQRSRAVKIKDAMKEAFSEAEFKVKREAWVQDGVWYNVDRYSKIPFGELLSFRDKKKAERAVKLLNKAVKEALKGTVEPQE